jgi:hypothetical protein
MIGSVKGKPNKPPGKPVKLQAADLAVPPPECGVAVFAVSEPPFAPIVDVVLEPDRLTTMRPIGGGPKFTIIKPTSLSVTHIHRYALIDTARCNELPLSPDIVIIEADHLTTMRPTGGGTQFVIVEPTSFSVAHIHRYVQIDTAKCQ